MRPHLSHTCTRYASELMNSRSRRKLAQPWLMRQSRSISPIRRPPSRPRPSMGCLVRFITGPLLRLWILSSTKCFKRW